jgi:hypothetical protein
MNKQATSSIGTNSISFEILAQDSLHILWNLKTELLKVSQKLTGRARNSSGPCAKRQLAPHSQ